MLGNGGASTSPIEYHGQQNILPGLQRLKQPQQALTGLISVARQFVRQLGNGMQRIVPVHHQMFLHFPSIR